MYGCRWTWLALSKVELLPLAGAGAIGTDWLAIAIIHEVEHLRLIALTHESFEFSHNDEASVGDPINVVIGMKSSDGRCISP